MGTFARENQALIDKSRKRKRAEALEGERRDLRAASGYDERAAALQQLQLQNNSGIGGGALPSFTLPQPLEADAANGGTTGTAQAEDARIAGITDPAKKRREQWALDEVRRIAGGFRREDDWKRCRQEAMEGLFM